MDPVDPGHNLDMSSSAFSRMAVMAAPSPVKRPALSRSRVGIDFGFRAASRE